MASVKDAVGDFSWSPTAPTKPDANKNDQIEPPSAADEVDIKILTRTITMTNFKHALNEVSPSSTEGNDDVLHRWHDRFGLKAPKDNNNSIESSSTNEQGPRACREVGGGSGYGSKAGEYSGKSANYGGKGEPRYNWNE